MPTYVRLIKVHDADWANFWIGIDADTWDTQTLADDAIGIEVMSPGALAAGTADEPLSYTLEFGGNFKDKHPGGYVQTQGTKKNHVRADVWVVADVPTEACLMVNNPIVEYYMSFMGYVMVPLPSAGGTVEYDTYFSLEAAEMPLLDEACPDS